MRAVFRFHIHRGLWMSANGRYDRHDRARRTRFLRDYAGKLGMFVARRHEALRGDQTVAKILDTAPDDPADGPLFTETRPCSYTATVSWPSKRRSDSDNAAPTVKALLDGLRDAGVLTDDNDDVIHERTYRRGAQTGQPGLYTIEFVLQDCTCPTCLESAES